MSVSILQCPMVSLNLTIRPGKRASRKSLKPDQLKPRVILSKATIELTESRENVEAVEDDVAENTPRPGKFPVLEDSEVPEDPKGLAIEVIGNDHDTRTDGINNTTQNVGESNQVDAQINESRAECDSVQPNDGGSKGPEENVYPQKEQMVPDMEEETSIGALLLHEHLAGSPSVHEVNLNYTRVTPFGESPVPSDNADTAKPVDDGEMISLSLVEDAKCCIETIVPEIVLDHVHGRESSDLAYPSRSEGMDSDTSVPKSKASEAEDSRTSSTSEEAGTAPTRSPENTTNQKSSPSESTNFEVEEHGSSLAGHKVFSPSGSFGSPRFSSAAQESAVTNKENATDILAGTEPEGVCTKEGDATPLQSAQSGDIKVISQESPAVRKLRHSIRLSMEDLTPEEITEAAAVFHNYTGNKESDSTRETVSASAVDDICQTLPKADPVVTAKGGETSEESVETAQGRTRSGARFSDDTSMLKDFLSRAQARKLAQPSSIPMSAPKPPTSPRRTPRKVLAELDSNSPSTQKQRDISSRPGTPPGKGKMAAIDFEDPEEIVPEPTSCRRSTRTRSPAPSKSAPGVPSFIPVRRADGADPVVLQKSAAQELAIVTRANTRRNKGQAKIPSLTLQSLPVEGSDLTAVKHGDQDAKSVGWDEKLVYFQEVPESAEVREEKRPRVRRLRSLGGVNGTPAPKKMMADVTISYGTPAPKRRGRMR